MSYTIAVPSSSIQKVLNYGIPSITSVSGGVAVANGAVTITSSYPPLPTVVDSAFVQANVATGIATSSYEQANTATTLAQIVYDYANTIQGGAATDNVARQIALSAQANTIIIQGVNVTQNTWISTNNSIQAAINATQNTRLNSIETINNNQNTTIGIIQGTDATQNIRLNSIETINNNQNTTISIIQGVDNTQNIRLGSIETILNNQNTNVSIVQGVDATQNTRLNSIETINGIQNTTISLAYSRANTSVNTFVGTTGTASTSNGRIIFQSTNGITVTGSGTSLSVNTPQDVRTTATPTFNNLILTNALPITQGGTGATSTAAALTNLLPTGTISGYVLTTGGPGTYYWAAGGGGGSGATPGTTISSTRLTYTATGSQTVYTTPTYIPGASQLRVYFDGLRQFASGYTETNSTTCTFGVAPAAGVVVLFEVDGYINNPYYANNITFTAPFGGIIASANTIQLAIQDLESRKSTLISPAFTGTPTTPTASIATNNTQIASTAYVKNLANSGITFAHNISGSATTSGTATTANALNISNNYQINSLGVGTAASGTTGEIRATNEVTAYFASDERLKENIVVIDDALGKLKQIRGVMYDWKDSHVQSRGGLDDYFVRKHDTGVIAQDVEKVLPEVVAERPDGTKAVRYEKLAGIMIQAINELSDQVEQIKKRLN